LKAFGRHKSFQSPVERFVVRGSLLVDRGVSGVSGVSVR
jgi:hypothetical protein